MQRFFPGFPSTCHFEQSKDRQQAAWMAPAIRRLAAAQMYDVPSSRRQKMADPLKQKIDLLPSWEIACVHLTARCSPTGQLPIRPGVKACRAYSLLGSL